MSVDMNSLYTGWLAHSNIFFFQEQIALTLHLPLAILKIPPVLIPLFSFSSFDFSSGIFFYFPFYSSNLIFP